MVQLAGTRTARRSTANRSAANRSTANRPTVNRQNGHPSLATLIRRRNRILKELSEIEQRIVRVAGKSYRIDSQSTASKRPKNSRPLHDIILEILQGRRTGVCLDPLSQEILKTGYQTSSSNFKNVLRQCLYHSSSVKFLPSSRRYILKKYA